MTSPGCTPSSPATPSWSRAPRPASPAAACAGRTGWCRRAGSATCSTFTGTLIRSIHIYVDPDFTSADRDRIRILRGEAAAGGGARAALERYLAAMRSGATPEAVAALFTEDADWDIPGAVDRVPWIGRRSGRAGVADFVRALWDGIEPIRFDITAIAAEGDRAFAAGDLESRARRTGRIMRSEFVIDVTARDGLISRFRLLEDSFAIAQAAA